MRKEITKINIEYTYRNIWINRSYDNSLSYLNTNFHLVPFADEINVWGDAFAEVTPPQFIRQTNETRRQKDY